MPVSNIKKTAVPEWQKEQVFKRLRDLQKNPSKLINWNEASKKIKRLAK